MSLSQCGEQHCNSSEDEARDDVGDDVDEFFGTGGFRLYLRIDMVMSGKQKQN